MKIVDLSSSPMPSTSSECQFCCHTKPLSEFTKIIPCDHQICTVCIKRYCKIKIESGDELHEEVWPCPWGDDGWFRPIIDEAWKKNVKRLSFWENVKLKITLSKQDRQVHKLAHEKHWRRCPKCRFYVQRINGCSHIRCRCGVHFCYDCGRTIRMCFCKYSLRGIIRRLLLDG